MYNNPYVRNYNQQNMYEQIDNQINQLQQMREQMKNTQQPAINQTFQLAPTNNHTIRYANTIDEVIKENVFYDTPFFSKDMSVLWLKSAKGDIKTYELTEIVPQDEKDIQIQYLQSQIEELRKEIDNNAKSSNTNDDEPVESKESTDVSISRTSTKKQKQSTRDI